MYPGQRSRGNWLRTGTPVGVSEAVYIERRAQPKVKEMLFKVCSNCGCVACARRGGRQSTGSAAAAGAAAGMRTGDIIVAVNGTVGTGVEQLRQLVQMAARASRRMSITVNREGTTLSVPVILIAA